MNAGQRTALLAGRPAGWEYLLFAGRLLQGRDALRLARRNYELRLPDGPYQRIEGDEVADFLRSELDHLRWIIEPAERVLAAHEDAFGKPGQAGEPWLIEHLADWIVETYGRLMGWAGSVRRVGVPEEYRPAVQLWAHLADASIEEVRAFIQKSAQSIEEVSGLLGAADARRGRRPIRLDLTLTVTLDSALADEAVAMLEDAVVQSRASGTSGGEDD